MYETADFHSLFGKLKSIVITNLEQKAKPISGLFIPFRNVVINLLRISFN